MDFERVFILYPSGVMCAWTLILLCTMGISRVRAVRHRQVPLGYYRLFEGDVEPDALAKLRRHVHNHFEIPPLFHIGCLLAYVTATVDPLTVGLAWGFVASRFVHSGIHLGPNDVLARFLAFLVGVVLLAGLWAVVLVRAGAST